MKRSFLLFTSGIIFTYIFNFIITTSNNDLGIGFFIADSFNNSLPKIFIILAVLCAAISFIWGLDRLLDKSNKNRDKAISETQEIVDSMLADGRRMASDIIAEAHTRAIEIPKEAQKEASKLRLKINDELQAAKNLRIQYEIRLQELEDSYQEAFDELEGKRQAYLDEIAGLQRRIEELEGILVKSKKKGIEKLRERGFDVAADRAERTLKRDFPEKFMMF